MDPLSPRPWLNHVLKRHGLSAPDGRPLYAYRIERDEFVELRMILYGNPAETSEHKALFCMYIAEWWRRNYSGGVWSWSDPLAALGIADDGYSRLYGAIQDGLRYWRRPLVTTRDARLFLVTLCCEGGLPLKLLEHDGHALSEFFRGLLIEQASAELPRALLPAIATRLAETTLSPRLQNTQVYELASDLVQAVADLRPHIPPSGDPLASLDRAVPGWRDRMPLDLADPIAEKLFRGLAKQALATPPRGTVTLRVSTELHQIGDAWRLRRRIDLPRHLPANALSTLFGKPELPAQLQLYAVVHAGAPVPLALASRYASSSAQGPRYILERTSRPLELSDADAVELLGLAGDRTFGPVAIPGGDPLTELPWIFAPTTEPDGQELPSIWRLHGQGSVRARCGTLLVAAGPGAPAQATPADAVRPLDELQTSGPPRRLHLLRGGSLVVSLPAGSCTIAAKADDDEADRYVLAGARLPPCARERPIYLGLPTIECLDTQGRPRLRSQGRDIEWRYAGQKGAWQPRTSPPAGTIELRHVVRGQLRWMTTLCVLPPTTAIDLDPSPQRGVGKVTVRAANAVHAHLRAPAAVALRPIPVSRGDHAWECSATGPVADSLELLLVYPGGQTIAVKVPFPGIDACFVDIAGHRLRDGERVFFGHVSGLVARITGSREALKAARIEAQLKGGARRLLNDFMLTLYPRQVASGRAEIQLGSLLRWSRLALASTTELDASIQVALHDGAGGTTVIALCRYDLALEPDRENNEIRLKADTTDPELAARIRLECFPFKEPERPPERLEPLAPGRWRFPGDRQAGSWLLVARDGDWCRARPLCFFVKREQPDTEAAAPEPPPSPRPAHPLELTAIVDLPNMTHRREAYAELLRRLVEEPEHPDWEPLFAYVRTLGDLPASTFEVIRVMSEFPALCARAAVDIALREPDTFPAFWQGMEDLPFFWPLVPFEAWNASIALRAGLLRQTLGAVGMSPTAIEASVQDNLGRVLDALAARSQAFELLANALRDALFGSSTRLNDPLSAARAPQGEALLMYRLADDLQNLLRRHSEDRWPPGSQLRDAIATLTPRFPIWKQLMSAIPKTADNRRPAILAPLFAACVGGYGASSTPALAIELRNLHAFDPEWFDQAHATVLTLIIAKQSNRT